MNSPLSPDPLTPLLHEWRLDPPVEAGFRPGVWQRIRRHSTETWTSYVQSHLAAWSLLAVVTVGAAGWMGHSAGRAELDANRDAMVVHYLVELDPRVQAILRPAAP